MNKIRVIIVEDQQILRQLWIEIFNGRGNIEVVGECGKQDEAIELISLKKPDIVLLDINLEQGSGIDALPLIRKISPRTRTIVLTMHDQPAYAKKMLQLGARGYVTKNSTIEEMFEAIDEVMENREYVCDEIKDILSDHALNEKIEGPDIKKLSLREIEIIKLMKEGLSSREISSVLYIGIRTVEVHRHNILKKLKLKNTASMVNFINHTALNFL